MPTNRGYQNAMHLLEDSYGNALKIANAMMEKVLKWPQRMPSTQQLCTLPSEFVLTPWKMDEMDNPTNMRVIISKLPFTIRERWRASALEIQVGCQRGVRPTDFVSFVNRHTKIVKKHLFGDLQGPVAKKNEKKVS